LRKCLAVILAGIMFLSFAGYGTKAAFAANYNKNKFKIGIIAGFPFDHEKESWTVEKIAKELGKDAVVMKTYPDNFMREQDKTIANLLAFASDPDIKAIIAVHAVPGTAAGFEKVRSIRPDILLIAGVPGEDPALISEKADVVLQIDELVMGYTIPLQAKRMGATTLVHYSFPRHMSYPLLSQRREIMRAQCEKLGMKFIDATAPDPLGDVGVLGAQQFILEDVPRKVEEYGQQTNFFSTNCALQAPLIKATLKAGAIFAQQCCPNPHHGYPEALGIEIPKDKAGDLAYANEQIKAKIAAQGGSGRFATWPVNVYTLFIEVGAKYAKDWANAKIKSKNDKEALIRILNEVTGTPVGVITYVGKNKDGSRFESANYYLFRSSYIVY